MDGRRLDAVAVTAVARRQRRGACHPCGALGSGVLSAAIDDREGFHTDNVRYAVLDSASAVSVVSSYCIGPALGVAVYATCACHH